MASKLTKVELDGKKYDVRRLSTTDIEMFNNIVGNILAGADVRGVSFSLEEGEELSSKIVDILSAGLSFAHEDMVEWLRSLPVGYPEEQPVYLPDIVNLIEAVADHPDVALFLGRSKNLLKKLTEKVQSLIPSTEDAEA